MQGASELTMNRALCAFRVSTGVVHHSTVDDRVHPGHARKIEPPHNALFYENTEGGHTGAANNQQSAYVNALEHELLFQKLKL